LRYKVLASHYFETVQLLCSFHWPRALGFHVELGLETDRLYARVNVCGAPQLAFQVHIPKFDPMGPIPQIDPSPFLEICFFGLRVALCRIYHDENIG
jgi:hypothetical protein